MANKGYSIKEIKYKKFNIIIQYKKVKYIRLKIDKNLCIKLVIPLFCSKKDFILFLDKHYKWLNEKYELLSKYSHKNDDEILFLGKYYKLIFDENIEKIRFKKGLLISKNKSQYEEFMKKNAFKIFSFYIKKWQKFFDKKIQRLSIKPMKTRWGSCNSSKAYINLNINLMQKSLKGIEYVVLHELTHLKFANHSKEFYKELENLMPDFRTRELEFKMH